MESAAGYTQRIALLLLLGNCIWNRLAIIAANLTFVLLCHGTYTSPRRFQFSFKRITSCLSIYSHLSLILDYLLSPLVSLEEKAVTSVAVSVQSLFTDSCFYDIFRIDAFIHLVPAIFLRFLSLYNRGKPQCKCNFCEFQSLCTIFVYSRLKALCHFSFLACSMKNYVTSELLLTKSFLKYYLLSFPIQSCLYYF